MLRSLIVVLLLQQFAHALDNSQAHYVIFASKKLHCVSIHGYFEILRNHPKLINRFPVSNAKINDIVQQLSKIHSLAAQIRQQITNRHIIAPKWLSDIAQLIQRLKRIQRNPFDHELKPFNRSDHVPKLFEWCSKVGIYYDAIHLQEIPGAGYGVVAAKDLPRNFIISKVPCSAMLSANEIKNSTIGNLIPTSMAESYTLPLALKLIFETFEPTEAWSPYIEFLPRALFHPLLFEPKDFIYLEGSRTYRVLTDVYFTNMIQYVQFYLHMLEQPHFFYNTPINWETLTFRLFMWATVNIQSRVLETDSCTGIIDEVMVPLYDMTNHDFDKNLDCFTDKSMKFLSRDIHFIYFCRNYEIIPSASEIDPITQTSRNYLHQNIKDGELSQTSVPIEAGDELVQHYGPDTVHTANFFTIWSAHCPGHRFAPIEANKVKLNGKSADGLQLKPHEVALKDTKDIVITGDEEYLVGDDSDLIYLLIAYGDAGDHEWPNGTLTSRIWQNVWREFRSLIQAALNSFRRTLPVNLAEYTDSSLSKGAKECLLQAICEQKILHETLDATERLMGWIENEVEDFGNRLLDNLPAVSEKIFDTNSREA